jgi:dolichol-phosphate hexosyltransferase
MTTSTAMRFDSASLRPLAAPRVAVVIPALNEEGGIGNVIDEVKRALDGTEFRIIVVDGRSSDRTAVVARERGAAVVTQRVAGYGGALMTGFTVAVRRWNPDVLVMIDGDGTYDPADIPKLIEPIARGDAELVVGNRLKFLDKSAMSGLNRFGNRLITGLARRLLGLEVEDTQCGLRAFSADLVGTFIGSADGMAFATEMLADAKEASMVITEVPITYRKRVGDAKMRPITDGASILRIVGRLLRDYKPMLFFGLLSLVCLAAGLGFGFRVLSEFLATGHVKEIPSAILSSALVVLSIQFFSLGLVADMIKGVGRRRKQVWEMGVRGDVDL